MLTSVKAKESAKRAQSAGPLMLRRSLFQKGPREKLLKYGVRTLTDSELLAVLIQHGIKGRSASEIAESMLHAGGSLAALFKDSGRLLLGQKGLGPARQATLLAALELGRRCAEQPLQRGVLVNSTCRTRRFLQHHLANREREVFSCLFLDSQHRLLHCEDLFYGTLNGAAVYPREVVTWALRLSAASVICAHNHPSGVTTPSEADRRITDRLKRALALVEIDLLDHIIVSPGAYYSFAEQGAL